MTTIAYKNTVLASDYAISQSNGVLCYAKKIWNTSKGFRIGVAGNASFINLIQRKMADFEADETECYAVKIHEIIREYDEKEAADVDAIIVSAGGSVYIADWYGVVAVFPQHGVAIGSGAKYALAAMMAGASSQKSIEIAAMFDHGTSIGMSHGPDMLVVPKTKGKK